MSRFSEWIISMELMMYILEKADNWADMRM